MGAVLRKGVSGIIASEQVQSVADMRQILLDAIKSQGTGSSREVTREAYAKVSKEPNNFALQQEILCAFHDLYRQGVIGWGLGVDDLSPNSFHLTPLGRDTMAVLDRDPANPKGYMKHLLSYAPLDDTSQEYVQEALQTYNHGCHRAAAVLLGVASENMILDLRDRLVERMIARKQKPSRALLDWKIKTVLEALLEELRRILGDAIRDCKESDAAATKKEWKALLEDLDAYVSTFAHLIRQCRNDAGHPASLNPVTPERTRGSLLMFPDLARLVSRLAEWVREN
jgi:hypothetical protein